MVGAAAGNGLACCVGLAPFCGMAGFVPDVGFFQQTLGVELGGPAVYHGQLHERPRLGEGPVADADAIEHTAPGGSTLALTALVRSKTNRQIVEDEALLEMAATMTRPLNRLWRRLGTTMLVNC